jgi:hypothetical protein
MGKKPETIDFIGDYESRGTKKRLIPSPATKYCQKRSIFDFFPEFHGQTVKIYHRTTTHRHALALSLSD